MERYIILNNKKLSFNNIEEFINIVFGKLDYLTYEVEDKIIKFKINKKPVKNPNIKYMNKLGFYYDKYNLCLMPYELKDNSIWYLRIGCERSKQIRPLIKL